MKRHLQQNDRSVVVQLLEEVLSLPFNYHSHPLKCQDSLVVL